LEDAKPKLMTRPVISLEQCAWRKEPRGSEQVVVGRQEEPVDAQHDAGMPA